MRARVGDRLAGAATPHVTLMALAGEQYRAALLHSQWPHEIPMKGLGIGQQLGWLTAKLSGEAGDGQTKTDA